MPTGYRREVFPARAGMSPVQEAARLGLVRVPRASGDEPHNTSPPVV